MDNTVKKIGFILFLIVFFPAIFFFYFELTSLSTNEQIVQQTYENQLDAILFSVNQYSEDLANNWAGRVEKLFSENDEKGILNFINENASVRAIFFAGKNSVQNVFNQNKNGIRKSSAESVIEANPEIIQKMISYTKSGYKRIETLKLPLSENSSVILFALNSNQNEICGIVIDESKFIISILSPRLQQISQNKFNILISENSKSEIIFATNPNGKKEIQQRKALWILPFYSIGISLEGKTIADIFTERNKINVILITAMMFIIIFAAYFVFSSIKKEIKLAQIKTDFVSNVSHELRTPLALINMFAETLELGRVRTEEKKQEYYSIISQEANRLSRIVNKILNFSKMEAGKITYNFSETDLNHLAENVFNTYKFHLLNSGFKFEMELDENLPLIKIDKEVVSEALINLIDNAAKYSKDKKEIKVKTLSNGKNVSVEISDCGIGISQEDQKRIFEKFFRVSTGSVHNTKGTGLGLPIVKHIMDAHKGSVSISSELGKGTTFKLNFPVSNNELN